MQPGTRVLDPLKKDVPGGMSVIPAQMADWLLRCAMRRRSLARMQPRFNICRRGKVRELKLKGRVYISKSRTSKDTGCLELGSSHASVKEEYIEF